MPPPAKKAWKRKACDHHIIWVRAGETTVVHACAHCTHTAGVHEDAGTPELITQQVRASRAGHAGQCKRPVR